jgi:hypothetical protein
MQESLVGYYEQAVDWLYTGQRYPARRAAMEAAAKSYLEHAEVGHQVLRMLSVAGETVSIVLRVAEGQREEAERQAKEMVFGLGFGKITKVLRRYAKGVTGQYDEYLRISGRE